MEGRVEHEKPVSRRWLRIIKKLGIAALIVFGIGAAFFIYERNHNPFVKVLTGGDTTFSTEPVLVKMGPTTLSIPRNYFSNYPHYGGQTGVPDAVEFGIHGLLPDIEPISETNKEEFRQLGWGKKIRIIFQSNTFPNMDTSRAAFDKRIFESLVGADIRRGAKIEAGESDAAELGYKLVRSTSNLYFRGSVSKPRDLIVCAQKDENRSPDCRRFLYIAPKVSADVSFSRNYLAQVKEIERRLIELLNQFRVSGPALEINP